MVKIANPIYDSVFKYLVEDTRVAKVLLSAILGCEVKNVVQLKNDVVNIKNRDLHILRVDFSAVVVDSEGREEQVCIELQKAWHPDEVVRFRTYLSTQYKNEANVDSDGNPLHIVAIYLLGHQITESEEPVIRVNRYYTNESGEVIEGRNQFIESLSHDLIVIQIPYVHLRRDTVLDRILSVFDQTKVSSSTKQYLEYDEDDTEEKTPGLYPIVRRLQSALVEDDVRKVMSVEDEIDKYVKMKKSMEDAIAEASKMKAENLKMEAEASKMKAEASKMKAENLKMEAEASKMKAEATKMKAENLKMEAEASKMKAENLKMEAEASKMKAEMSKMEAETSKMEAKVAKFDSVVEISVRQFAKMGMPAWEIAKTLKVDEAVVDSILNE